MGSGPKYSKMEQDLLTNLPSEITIDILSRLPPRTAMSCKFVHKSLRDLIGTPEFAQSYKSVPCLVVFREEEMTSKRYSVYEVEDELKCSENPLFSFIFPDHPLHAHSSASGLLFFLSGPSDQLSSSSNILMICNPVSREYIKIPSPLLKPYLTDLTGSMSMVMATYGFGTSKLSGHFKIVVISHESRFASMDCQVYTLGTGLWRTVVPDSGSLVFLNFSVGAYLRGNLHGCAADKNGQRSWIFCFDLETEVFTTFSPPNPEARICFTLSCLRDSLCLCDNMPSHESVIWLMKEYGDDKSWSKQYVIPKIETLSFGHVSMRVIKVFNNDDVLLTQRGYRKIVCYSNETKTFKEIKSIDFGITYADCYTPSFLQLKTFFPVEDVRSF